ncbi:TPM domain-containing protein [Thermaurantiacus sp.]
MRLLLALLLLLAGPAFGQSFPALTGRVVDAAKLLPPEAEARLTAKLAALETATGGTQLVVATIPDLEGLEISDYGYRLGRHWGIGQKGANNGVILLVAPNERRVRVEVGYGLEPILTDALSALIIQERILPALRAGNFAGGIEAGADALIEQLQLPPEEAERRAAAARAARASEDGEISFSTILFFVILLFAIWLVIRSSGGGSGGGRRRGPAGPIIIWGPGMGGFGGGFSGGFGGGFSGGGGSFGGGGASGGW